MSNQQKAIWVLRIAVAGEFLGHGIFALQGKADWIKWFGNFGVTNPETAGTLLMLVGLMDVLVALVVLFRPLKPIVLWAAFWGFWTALVRPLVGQPIWDFVERFANWSAPLALLLILGWPKSFKEWFR